MALDQHQPRVQPHLLQAGSNEHGEVQAGAHHLLHHLVRRADLLSPFFKAGRGVDVAHPHLLQGCVECLHHVSNPRRIPSLIACQGRVAGLLLKHPPGLHQHLSDGRVVGLDKGRQQLGKRGHAVPLVVGQQVHPVPTPHHRLALHAHHHLQLRGLPLGDPDQPGQVQLQFYPGQVVGAVLLQRLDARLPGLAHSWLQLKHDLDVLQAFARSIGEPDGRDQRHRVVRHGQVEGGGVVHFDQEGEPARRWAICGRVRSQ